jgi:NADH-quinone oxidoreductase subunit M
LAAVALPLTSSFVGEFLVIIGSWQAFPQWTSVALIGVVLGAVYTLTAYLKVMFGPEREPATASGADLQGGDVLVLGALAALVIILGIFPQGALSSISPAIEVQLAQAAGSVEDEAKAQLRARLPSDVTVQPARLQSAVAESSR